MLFRMLLAYSLWDYGSFAFSLAGEILLWRGIILAASGLVAEASRPNKATWAIWTIANGMLGVMAYRTHGPLPQILAYTLGSAAIAFYACLNGAALWTRDDRIAAMAALIVIATWWFAPGDTLPIILAMATFAIGTWPLAKAKWRDHRVEGCLPWWLFLAGGSMSVCSMGAYSSWEWPGALITLGCLALEIVIALLTLPWRPARRQAASLPRASLCRSRS